MVVVAHRDGHVLAVTTAMLLVSRWCIRSRQNQVLSSFLIALQCAPNFCAVVLTKENVATKENVPAKALVVDLDPRIGRPLLIATGGSTTAELGMCILH